jgi:spore maturation protein SpmA
MLMMNKIWIILIFFGLIISMFTGNFTDMGNLILNSGEKAFSVF